MTLKKPDSPPFSVVGIGASAGGVEALRAFFEALPERPNAAFVVIIHLDPEHASELGPILGRCTGMPVKEVQDSCSLEANHVYVISPNRQLQIADGTVSASPFTQPRWQRSPIDAFFRSLAQQYGDGFAIILSGSGSDGADGIKAIKEQGGLILVQTPAEASFDGMPQAAIATGMTDFVLPVRQLAQQLPELIENKHHIYEHLAETTQLKNEETRLGRIFAYLQKKTGHDFSKYKRPTMLRRLAHRMQLHRQKTLTSYFDFLRENPEEPQALFEELLISVTAFFRDPAAWEALREQVIPRLFEEKAPETPLRVWVPGCATGEEAYSLAILLLEEAERRGERSEIQIFATDLDEGVLAIARTGRYPATIRAALSESQLRRYFIAQKNYYRITGAVRDCILFSSHSLVQDPPFSRLDLISCRNLLIYLTSPLQEQVFAIFHYALRQGGYLFLGASENGEGKYFGPLDKSHRLFQRQQNLNERVSLPHLLSAPYLDRRLAPPSTVASSILAHTHREILEEFAPPSLLVDERYQVLHLSNTVGRFLQPAGGLPSQEVTALVRPALQSTLSTVLYRAFEKNEPSLSPFTTVPFNGTSRQVAILVQPRSKKAGQEKMALVIFLESSAKEPAPFETVPSGKTEVTTLVRQLREELRQAHAQLRTKEEESKDASEDLRAVNEELQSMNEEYRSITKELETSKEELQSINEELQTLNSELKSKLEEISQANSDLENFMAATEIGTLFLDRRLRILRFTPPITKLFPITAHDYGRPITHFTHHFSYNQLEADAHEVLRTLVPIEHEIKHQKGTWYLVVLRPYRSGEDRIDGLLVTFVDITTHKEAEQLQDQDRQKDEFLAVLGHELRNPLAVIYNTTEILIRSTGTMPKDQQRIELIGRQVKHLLRLVDDLLNLTRINSGQIQLNKQPLPLKDCITSAIELIRLQIETCHHKLALDLSEPPLYLEADPDRLTQIVANLLSNAAHYTKAGGQITIKTRRAGDKALIRVRDTGIGFTPEQLPQLFGPFGRVQSAATHHRSGLGLGLNLARKLAVLHGGTLEAFSAGPDQGSEFTVCLPALPTERPDAPAPAPAETDSPPAFRRILLVEDDEAVADSLSMLLRLQGHEVQTIFQGSRTLEAVLKFRPEVVLMDIGLADMDGYQVAQRLRQEPGLEALPLVALSGYGQAEDIQQAKAAGFDHHLLKPATLEALQKILREL